MLRNLLFLTIISSLASCSSDKVFLLPRKIPFGTSNFSMIDRETRDTTNIYFAGKNWQPTIKNAKDEVKSLSYSIESAVITSTSGNKIHGWFFKPNNVTTRETILFLHGNAGNILGHTAYALPLVKKGFQVFLIDYSGFGFSTGDATITNVRKDANAALQWLVNKPEVQSTKLIVYGQSLGGHLAVTVAQENEDLIDALVVEGAFSSHRDIAAHTSHLGIIARAMTKEPYSATESIQQFHKPVLIIHSTDDETIPFYMGKRIYFHANEPKSFYQIQHPHIEGPIHYSDSISFKIREMVNDKKIAG